MRDLRIEASKQFDYSKHPRLLFLSKNGDINRLNLGMTIQFASSSLINGSDEMLKCESSSLSHVHLIRNGAPR